MINNENDIAVTDVSDSLIKCQKYEVRQMVMISVTVNFAYLHSSVSFTRQKYYRPITV